MSSVVFPSSAEALTPGILTAALRERHPGVVVDRLRIVDTAHCDSGSASTAGRVILELEYAPGRDAGLPSQIVLKTMLIRPGALAGMYHNEVRFYRDLRSEIDIETPEAYAGTFDRDTGHFGVLMEDVTLRGASFPDATTSMPAGEIVSLLDGLARLHARFWNSPRFARDLAWLWTPTSGGFYDFIEPHGLEIVRHQVELSTAKQAVLRGLERSLDDLWGYLWKAQRVLEQSPVTLLHGDCHYGNTYRLPGGQAGVLDWQLMQRGSWAHDVTYLLVTGLDTEYRRTHERFLLTHYLDRLRALGVDDAPAPDAAWRLHRQAAIWGLVIGWFICPIENYGAAILQANLDRLGAAVEDLETFAALDEAVTS